jgi:lipopolysaccharide heptosyltransferase II
LSRNIRQVLLKGFDVIGVKQPGIFAPSVSRIADVAALGVLVKIGPWKRFFIRLIETILRPVVSLVERLRSREIHISREVRSILVLEYWNLGDIVMQSPFLQNLRIHYPNARIVLLTSPKCAPLLEHQDVVDEVVAVRVPWAQHYSRWRKYNPFSLLWIELLRTIKLLYARRFDLAFTARADIRENLIIWLLGVRQRVGYSFGGGGFLLTDCATADLEHVHFSNRWLRLLEHVDKPVFGRQPHLRLSQEEQDWAELHLAERGVQDGDVLIGVHPGARSAIRQWGKENFAIVAQRLRTECSVKVLWFEDGGQTTPATDQDQFIRVSLPLRRFMSVLAQCRMLICNDSGPMHIATALNIPVVAVFGPTEPAWFGPLGQDHQVVIRPEFWCRPCFDYCLFDQPYCLRLITVDSVFESAVETLKPLLRERRRSLTREASAC